MIDQDKYIILEVRMYKTREDASKQVREVYSNLLGVIPMQDNENGKWYIVRVKTQIF